MTNEEIRALILKKAEGIEYRDAKHQYIRRGAEAASVTRIIRPLDDAVMASIPQEQLEAARLRGTEVHAGIKDYLDTGIDLSEGEISEYIDGFAKFAEDFRLEVIASEFIVYHEVYGYCGRADLLGRIKGEDKPRIFDYKATFLLSMSVPVQMFLYNDAINRYGIETNPSIALHLTPGHCDPREFVEEDFLKEVSATARGLIALESYKFKYIKGGKR